MLLNTYANDYQVHLNFDYMAAIPWVLAGIRESVFHILIQLFNITWTWLVAKGDCSIRST
jgi:hypothetical protein